MPILTRRVVVRHTTGPYPGLRQIIGAIEGEAGELPDVLPPYPQSPAPMWPDQRLTRCLRLKSTDTYVLYTEQAPEAVLEPAV